MARTSRPRLHALDGLRGLAALAVLVLHVWMYTDANFPAPGRTDLLDTRDRRAARRDRAVLRAERVPARPAVGRGKRRPRALRRATARAHRPRVLGGADRLAGDPARHRARARHRAARRPEVRLLRRQRLPRDPQPARPADVVDAHRGLVLRRAAADRARAAARRAAPAARLRGADGGEPGVSTLGEVRRLAARDDLDAADLPRRVRRGDRGGVRRRRAPRSLRRCSPAAPSRCSPTASGTAAGPGRSGTSSPTCPPRSASRRSSALAARPGRVLSSAPLRALGTISFGLYLWHMPVLYALQLHERFPERFLPALAWVLPFTLRARGRRAGTWSRSRRSPSAGDRRSPGGALATTRY